MQKIILSWGRVIPQIVKNIRDGVIYAAGGAVAFSQLLAPKFSIPVEDFCMWCGIIILGAKVFAKFFGISEEEAVKNVGKAVKEANRVTDNDTEVTAVVMTKNDEGKVDGEVIS